MIFFLSTCAYWFSETFVSKWMDKGVIDGILHIFGPTAALGGSFAITSMCR